LKKNDQQNYQKISNLINESNVENLPNKIYQARIQFIKKVLDQCFIKRDNYVKTNKRKEHKIDKILLNK